MATLYLSHDAFLSHEVPEGHPERPDRLRALKTTFENARFDRLLRREAPSAAARSRSSLTRPTMSTCWSGCRRSAATPGSIPTR